MRTINDISEKEAKILLNEIAEKIGIGGAARTAAVMLTNIENALRRSNCLSKIEAHHTIIIMDDEDEEVEKQLLYWGDSPEAYIENYLRVVTPNVKVAHDCAAKTIIKIIEEGLAANGFDGLVVPGHCGCLIGDISPGGCLCDSCLPAYKHMHKSGEWITSTKKESVSDEEIERCLDECS